MPNHRIDQIEEICLNYFIDGELFKFNKKIDFKNNFGMNYPLKGFLLDKKRSAHACIIIIDPAKVKVDESTLDFLGKMQIGNDCKYIVVIIDLHAWIFKKSVSTKADLQNIKEFNSRANVSSFAEEFSPLEQIALKNLLFDIEHYLYDIQDDGQSSLVMPDVNFFVDRLTKAVTLLKPAVKQALFTKLQMDNEFANEIVKWAILQGIPEDIKSESFAEAVVRQAIYRLLGKIIFYQSLRRARSNLPELNLANLDTSQVLPQLAICFSKAHEIDYHAVFRDDIIDRLPYPAIASAELRNLVEDLNTRDFAHLPQDVIGAVFERLIPPEDRHALGQFFTPEPLVDLITGFCVRDSKDKILDPTCGTGTFLIRAYNNLRTLLGVHDHNRLLGQLWGIDIAPFPAELATINLFRQKVEDFGNFPRILNEDFFHVTPGGHYRFPPLKGDIPNQNQVEEQIPQFDAIVGNFPYISADHIEQAQKGYLKNVIYKQITKEWFIEYPSGFTFSQARERREFELAQEKGLPVEEYHSSVKPDVSIYSDFYAYLFWHAAAFLKPGGRMGIVTSNAWLDVGFGYSLQRFFLNHFKIIAILESRCEPWFEQAAVNTVVTILERSDDLDERDAQPVRFVKIKQRLNQLIPWDMRTDALNRWLGIKMIVKQVESVIQGSNDSQHPMTWESDAHRVRVVKQGSLRKHVEEKKQTAKWGAYLRAPQVFFDILKETSKKLTLLREIATPTRGGTTRINEFFYITNETICKWGIDPEFCLPLIKSPGETSTILIDPSKLEMKVFICRKSKDELLKAKQLGTLDYIKWGETQEYKTFVQRGCKWPDGPWVKDRKPGWYALPQSETHSSHLFFTRAYGDRHIQRYCSTPLIADARLYFLSPSEKSVEIISAIINSSIFSLFIEIAGRVPMGDGALELTVEDARDNLLIPDMRLFKNDQIEKIVEAFQPLLHRQIGSVFKEMHESDRKAFDSIILESLGLSPKKWLPIVYDGLSLLVSERMDLAKKRSQTKKTHTQKAIGKVLDDVLEELLPNGPSKFPEDFLSEAAKSGQFYELELPSSPLRYAGSMFGKEELVTQDHKIIQVNNKFEVQFVLFSQRSGTDKAIIPIKQVECSRTVNEYKKYLRHIRQQLREAFFRRTLDQAQAERLTIDAYHKISLPDFED